MSLRLRLMLAVTAVVLASIAAVAITSSRVVRLEFETLARNDRGPQYVDRGAIAARVVAHYRAQRWTHVDVLLRELRSQTFRDYDLLLVDANDRFVAATAPVRDLRVTRSANGVRIDFMRDRNSLRLLFGGGEIVVRDGDAILGTLFPTPVPQTGDPIRNVNRGLLAIVGVVGILALLSTALLARNIVRPIEELQRAVSRIESGELASRVDVRSRDELGRLGQAFNAMSEQLARDEVLRRNLVNDVAHELRTPLTNLLCTVEAVQDGLRSADAKTIDSLHDDLSLLQHLVDDLQTLALAEAGKLPLHPETIDVRELVGRFDVTNEVPEGVRVSADRVRFRQILANLVTNARHHGGDAVVISARVVDNFVEIAIRDNGPGIATEHLPHIFDRFYRADPSRARATGGAGLGLAIVKNLVELHGGRIAVESGQGTTFRITLPR